MCIPKFNNVSNFVFHAKKKTKQSISKSYFFPDFKKQNQIDDEC